MTKGLGRKLFWIIFILLILYAIFDNYSRIYLNKDYLISNHLSCDPSFESCFTYDIDYLCEGDQECIDSLVSEDFYYKIIYKKAANIEHCSYNPDLDESCPELSCELGEKEEECYIEYCEEDCNLDIDI